MKADRLQRDPGTAGEEAGWSRPSQGRLCSGDQVTWSNDKNSRYTKTGGRTDGRRSAPQARRGRPYTGICPSPHICPENHYSSKKGEGSPYSITERRVPELIPVLGSQPAGDVSHKPGGRLPLLSARPAVTPQPLRGLLRITLLLGERRHNGCEQFA